MIDHKAEANDMMRKGRARALEQFTIQATARGIKKLYQEILNERRKN